MSFLIKEFEYLLQGDIIAGANFLKLVSLLIEHCDVDLKFAELRELKAFFYDVLGSLAFCVSHFDWVGNWVQDGNNILS